MDRERHAAQVAYQQDVHAIEDATTMLRSLHQVLEQQLPQAHHRCEVVEAAEPKKDRRLPVGAWEMVVYSRSSGQVEERFRASPRGLLRKWTELDQRFRSHPDTEIVLLASSSVEMLQRTHARYYKSAAELLLAR